MGQLAAVKVSGFEWMHLPSLWFRICAVYPIDPSP